MKKRYITTILAIGLLGLLLAACGPSATEVPSPTTMSIEMAYTAAAETVIARLTQEAPVNTPTLSPSPTLAVTATETPSPTLTPTKAGIVPVATSTSCANSIFVTDVTIPDGSLLTVNTEFTKTWRVKNTGTCPWTTSFKLVFSYGELMSGVNAPLTAAVQPGQEVDLSVKLKVPNKSGQLTGVWILTDEKGLPFGTSLTVVIKTTALTLTPSQTPTSTATKTGTLATPTFTSTPTVTTVPATATFTSTPTLTSVPPTATETPTVTNTTGP